MNVKYRVTLETTKGTIELGMLADKAPETVRAFLRLTAAGIYDGVGVHRVVPRSCSSAHAEVVALSLAQQSIGGHDLGGPGQPAHQIVVNWAPCAMCCGAICWSGVRSVVIAGSGPEMEELTGFDEGPLHPQWASELRRRGIAVRDGLLRGESLEAFRQFATSGRAVYNARQG